MTERRGRKHGPFMTVEDLLDIPGIGEAKLNNYGEILLDIIAAHGGEA